MLISVLLAYKTGTVSFVYFLSENRVIIDSEVFSIHYGSCITRGCLYIDKMLYLIAIINSIPGKEVHFLSFQSSFLHDRHNKL